MGSCEPKAASKRRWRRFLDSKAFPLQAFVAEWSRWVVEALGWHDLFRVMCQTKVVTQGEACTIAGQVQPGETVASAIRIMSPGCWPWRSWH
jgi:hypothetical protein